MTEQTAADARPPRHVMSVDFARAHENQRTGGGPDKRGLVEILERLQLLPDPHSAARHVEKIRDGHPGTSAAALAKKEVNATVLRCTGIGVVAGLPGTIPGLGTFAQACATLGIAGGEAAILLRNVARLQYTVAGLYGHDLFAPERLDELLIVAGLESGAILPAREAGKRVGTKIAVKQFDRHVSGAMLRKLNTKLGTTVLAKYGTKRGGLALGRMLPFGVGATIGGGVNLVATKSFGRAILRYYGQIQPGGEMLFVPADT
jgi:hypothetical protein